ncbi:uncharacterized protein METZ01_LOCUS353330, partial [marine metagenome]
MVDEKLTGCRKMFGRHRQFLRHSGLIILLVLYQNID